MPEDEVAIDLRKRPDDKIKLSTDATYAGNAAGQAVRGELNLQVKPIPVSLGVGGGVINFNYFKPQPYELTSVNFHTNLGARGYLYGRIVNAFVPSTDVTAKQDFQAGAIGGAWSLLPAGWEAMLKLGFEMSGRLSESGYWHGIESGPEQGYGMVGLGGSFGYRSLIAYIIGRAVIAPDQATQAYWTENIRPWPYEGKVGFIEQLKNKDEKAELGAEVFAMPFQTGGKVFFKIDAGLNPELFVTYRKTAPLFGDTSEVGIGFSFNMDVGNLSVRGKASQEFGGETLAPVSSGFGYVPSSFDTNLYLYGSGKISYSQFYSRMSPYQQEQLQKWQKKNNSPYPISDALGMAKHDLGPDFYSFLDNFFSSGTLSQFASNYANSTVEQKIIAAARLGAYGHNYYGYQLENASPFSNIKSQIGNYQPQEVFSTMQKDVQTNKNFTDGICVNINGAVAEFLRQVGVDAYGISVGPHYFAAARDPSSGSSYVVNYGNIYKASGTGLWPAIEAYAKSQGMNLMDVYVFGKGNEKIGMTSSPEGRLMAAALGMDEDLLRHTLVRRNEPPQP